MPHGIASDKEVEIGDFITFDFGAVYDGYHSDMTRTVVLGMANSWHKEIYTIVEEAQWRGLKNAKPGITGAELDAIVRDYITSRRLWRKLCAWTGTWYRPRDPRNAEYQ